MGEIEIDYTWHTDIWAFLIFYILYALKISKWKSFIDFVDIPKISSRNLHNILYENINF